jgi:hypothetical protein
MSAAGRSNFSSYSTSSQYAGLSSTGMPRAPREPSSPTKSTLSGYSGTSSAVDSVLSHRSKHRFDNEEAAFARPTIHSYVELKPEDSASQVSPRSSASGWSFRSKGGKSTLSSSTMASSSLSNSTMSSTGTGLSSVTSASGGFRVLEERDKIREEEENNPRWDLVGNELDDDNGKRKKGSKALWKVFSKEASARRRIERQKAMADCYNVEDLHWSEL